MTLKCSKKFYGKTFTITAEGISKECKFVDRIELDGEKIPYESITYDQIMEGGNLKYVMK